MSKVATIFVGFVAMAQAAQASFCKNGFGLVATFCNMDVTQAYNMQVCLQPTSRQVRPIVADIDAAQAVFVDMLPVLAGFGRCNNIHVPYVYSDTKAVSPDFVPCGEYISLTEPSVNLLAANATGLADVSAQVELNMADFVAVLDNPRLRMAAAKVGYDAEHANQSEMPTNQSIAASLCVITSMVMGFAVFIAYAWYKRSVQEVMSQLAVTAEADRIYNDFYHGP